VATMPFETLRKLLDHPLTDRGLERFLEDWEEYQATNEEASAVAQA
ncbi:MAG: fructose-6-phosphate aldolase, partial [Bacteroidetes bacterium QH_6_63_17]